jgi:hypothetical protein
MELSTHAVGLSTELAVMKDFVDHGFVVSRPLNPDSRYDCIVDAYGHLLKVQIKSPRKLKDKNSDGFYIKLTSSRTHRWGVQQVGYDNSDVDLFATYHNGTTYIIPQYEVAGMKQCVFRLSSRSNQRAGVRFAADYSLPNCIERMGQIGYTAIPMIDAM